MTAFFVHDSRGRITRTGDAPEELIPLQVQAGETVEIGRANDALDYVTDGILKPRPEMSIAHGTDIVSADGSTATTLTGLPDPVDVTITGPVADSFECTGGTLELTFVMPGTYTVRLSKFPYLDAAETIHAT